MGRIKLICTSGVHIWFWAFSHPEFHRAHCRSGCSLVAVRWQVFFSSWVLLGTSAHAGGLQALIIVTSFVYRYERQYFICHRHCILFFIIFTLTKILRTDCEDLYNQLTTDIQKNFNLMEICQEQLSNFIWGYCYWNF